MTKLSKIQVIAAVIKKADKLNQFSKIAEKVWSKSNLNRLSNKNDLIYPTAYKFRPSS